MWQTYVQTAENTSIRREAINRYMVPVHLAILAGHLALPLTEPYHFLVGVAGMGVSYLWLALLDAHSKINEVKYDIILAMEKDLPSQPFKDERKPAALIAVVGGYTRHYPYAVCGRPRSLYHSHSDSRRVSSPVVGTLNVRRKAQEDVAV